MPPKAAALAAKRKLDSKAERLRQKQCWSFLLECTHSLNDGPGCPLCKLARSATREHYRLEQIKKLGKIAAGGLEKAQMRAELLEMWARSQLSSYGALKTGTPSAEISFSAAALTALAWYCEHKDKDDSVSTYFSGVRNDLELRKRIYQVGHYAALCIQRFVRSYLCRQRVKAFMMKRFEYTFPTRYKPGYYIDKKTKDFWPEAPRLVSSDGPTSPRTLVRRLNAVQRRKEDKESQMKELLAKEIASPGKVWRDKVETITCIRQLAILRDVIACAFKTLTKRQTRSAYRDLPVWLSLSHPAPAARQFGLNLVLENEEPLSEMSCAPADGEHTSPSADDEMTVNDRLQILEELSWQQLVCESPEDVIEKLTCEEVQPALSSGHQIAEDPHQMWIGHVNFTETVKLFPSTTPPVQPEPEKSVVEPTAALSMGKSRAGSNEFGSFEDLDDAFLDDELGNEQAVASHGRAPPPDGSTIQAVQFSMESVVSPLASPRVGQDQSKWISPVFPTLVYVPPVAHVAGAAAAVPTEEIAEEAVDPESAAAVALEEELSAAAALARQHYEKELVVPVQLQLRACNEKRHPAGIFRLFFYDGVLVSVTQGSAWTCYKEIVAAKDTIVASLIEYANSEQCRKVLQTMARIEEEVPAAATVTSQGLGATDPGDLASILSGFQSTSSRGNLLPPIGSERDATASLTDSQSKDVGRSECMQLYVPSDQALFGTDPIAMAPESSTTVMLTVEECKELQSQHTFLRHLSTWRAAIKAAMKRGGSKNKKKTEVDDTADAAADEKDAGLEINSVKTADNTVLTAIAKTFGIAVPYASDLVSADYFRLLNMDVPTAARPHMASREMFLAEYFSTNGFTTELGKGTEVMNDLMWQSDSYPLLKYEDVPTDLLTLVPPILLSSNIKHLHAPRYRVEPNASWYLSELLRIACSVNLHMKRRLRSMRPVPAVGADPSQELTAEGFSRAVSRAAKELDVEPLCEHAPELNIVVLDVFLDIPRPKLKGDFGCEVEELHADDGPNSEQGGSSAFTMKSMFGGDKKAKKKVSSAPEPPPMIPVSLHQVIGVFPSTLPRPPPSVDMGLASWDVVLAKGETPDTAEAAARLSKKGSYGRSAGLKKREANNWTTSRALPGVALLNKRLHEGNNCHFRVLKTPLPQEYIEENIPKKFRKWLGMEY